MTFFSNTKKARSWVLFILLAYVGQSFGMVGHAGMMLSDASANASVEAVSSCHSSQEAPNTAQVDEVKNLNNCCDNGCSMMNCSSSSAILGSSISVSFVDSQQEKFATYSTFTSVTEESIFHPPILG